MATCHDRKMRKLAANDVSLMPEMADTMPTDLGAPLTGIWKTPSANTPKSEAEWVEQIIAQKFPLLTFPRQLENQYLESMPRSALANLFVVLAATLFLISDYIMVPDVFGFALMLRLVVLMPFGLLQAVLSWMAISPRLREKMLLFTDLLAAVVQVSICLKSDSDMAQAYLIGISIIMLYATSHLRIRFWVSLVSSMSILAIFGFALTKISDHQWPLLIAEGILLVAVAVFTFYYLYTLEHESRMNFLMTLKHQHMQTQLRKANRTLDRVSRVDALTQVANRRHFDQFIQHVWQRAKGDEGYVTVLMLDVDCFKGYNDYWGHLKGDDCLIAVAKAMYKSLRKPGDLVARYGGEEFIAVLNKTDINQGKEAAERIRKAVQNLHIEHPTSTASAWVTVSVGVATLRANTPHASQQTLIAMADKALYEAKNNGRNRVMSHEVVVANE